MPPIGSSAKVRPLTLTSAQAFDPFSDDHQGEQRPGPQRHRRRSHVVLVDQQYKDPPLPFKPGVGLAVTLERQATLRRMVVSSPTSGWAATIYVAKGRPPSTLAKWGEPVARRQNLRGGGTVFDLAGRQGDAVLIWITHTGPDGTARIANVQVEGTT